MIRQFELVEAVKSYDRMVDEDALNRAYVFAMKAHGNQKRASGDPYFLHPLEVAGILTKYKLDTSSIITALLHDTIEDTDVTSTDVNEQFGEEIAQLVDGVTKLTQIELQSQQSDQAENFRKLLLAMSEDIRVLLVKLADRLHNMRTLEYIKSADKRRRIASETMEIYAPLAERIGMQELKNELEDLSFAELNTEARNSIIQRLQFLRDQGRDNVEAIITELTETMRAEKLRATVNGREKLPYSIWRKTQRKKVSFEQVADIMAFRVLVENSEECYRALGIIHSAYSSVPGRFKDYISTPKPNGYQSLHTSVIGPAKQRIELQIRTHDMHEVAELGVAAHWQYKHGLDHNHGHDYRWLRELLEILDHAASPDDFLEHTKLEMFADQVFCFTPAGEVIALPGGATPVDFAYAVHSEVGDTCVGAKINGRSTPLRTELENGDQVEIITSGAQTPSPMWENFVVTGKARSRIRRFIRLREKEEYMVLGRAILERAFAREDYAFNEALLGDVLAVFAVASNDDLAAAVGAGEIAGRQVLEAVYPGIKDRRRDGKVIQLVKAMNPRRPKKADGKDGGIPIKGLIPGMALHFAACCNALPGDRIVGIITKGRGVTIHTIDCETLEEFADMEERWLDVSWDADAIDEYHVARVELIVTNETGSLGELSTVIARGDGNISNLKITNRTTEFFDIMIDIQVRDVKHLTNIIAALRASPVINSVERARG
jgi:GTP pyrophosphokinase